LSIQLNEHSAALRPKLRAKELEKSKQRQQAKDEEERLSDLVNTFVGEFSSINNVEVEIKRSADIQEESNLAILSEKLSKLDQKKDEREDKIAALDIELQRAIRSINDQDTQRKLIQGSIEVMHLRSRLQDLKKEMSGLREDLEQIEGHAVATKEFNSSTERKEQLLDQKARLEGRRGGFVDQIRTLKVSALVIDFASSIVCELMDA
jgi:chromosome segregation ATPase